MADNNPSIVLDGDVSPFRQKLREAAADLKKFGDEGKTSFERMTGPLGALQSKFIAIGALLAGGQVFKAAVEESQKLTGEANALSKAMGISTTEAGALNIALGDIYSGAEEFIGASQQLSRQLRTNEADLNAMGLRTRESNGEYRNMQSLMMDSIKVLSQYKEGTDRTLAAQTLFGRGAGEVGKLLKLNTEIIEDARKKQEELGLVVGVENVEASKAYKAAMNDAGDVMSAFRKAIGDAVMPVLTKLAEWFNAIGPAAVQVTRLAIGGLVSAFWILKHAVVVVWETVNAMVVSVAEPIRALGEAIGRSLAGDFEGAKKAITSVPAEISSAWKKANSEIDQSATEIDRKIKGLFSKPTATTPKPATGNGYVAPPDKEKSDKTKADPSMMSYYEAALSEEKRLASEKDALRDYTKEEERAFWQTLLNFASLNAKDRVTIEKKVSDLTVAIRRQEAKEKQDLDAEAVRMGEATALGRVDAEAAAAQAAVSNSQMSKLQLAQLEMQFEQQRLEIQRAALQERLLLLDRDPNVSPVERQRLQNQIEQLEQQHGIRMVHLQSRVAQESGQIWDDLSGRMSSLWDKGVNAMMNGTLRWKNAFKAIGMELVSWFATSVVGEQVKVFLAGQVKQLAIKMGFLGQEKTAQTIASSHIVTTKGNEAISVSTANAVEAGTGAAGAMAPTPFVGPVLALAAMAAVFAAVMAMGSKVKSASKGFDIPKGMNPMTQLHEEEMVLPAAHAEVIRRLAAGEGGGSSNSTPIVNLNFTSAYQDRAGIKRFFSDNSPAVAEAIRKAMRDFHGR